MFKSMRLKNFKAYKDSGEVPLAPLTVIVGANNSGKSTLFQALLALAQTAQGADQGWRPGFVPNGRLVNLNGFHDIVHGGGKTKSPTFEISVGLDARAARRRTLTGDKNRAIRDFRIPDHVSISFDLDEDLDGIYVNCCDFRTGDETSISIERIRGRWSILKAPDGVPEDMEVDFVNVFPFLGVPSERMDPPPRAYTEAYAMGNFSASLWAEIFKKYVSHIGPLRIRVPWYASVGARTSSEFGWGGENLLADLGSKGKDLRTGKTRIALVNEWLAAREILKAVHLQDEKDTSGRMLLGDEWSGATRINVAGMGEGVSQILPIIAYTLFGTNDDCLLVEQPEIHLHPALQAELGDLFIDVAQDGHRQILVETHSEHLLLRVRRRIAEGTLKPEQVSILFVEKHKGESKVRRLDLNSRGHFSDWPKGFFDEAYQEAMALAAASSKKG